MLGKGRDRNGIGNTVECAQQIGKCQVLLIQLEIKTDEDTKASLRAAARSHPIRSHRIVAPASLPAKPCSLQFPELANQTLPICLTERRRASSPTLVRVALVSAELTFVHGPSLLRLA